MPELIHGRERKAGEKAERRQLPFGLKWLVSLYKCKRKTLDRINYLELSSPFYKPPKSHMFVVQTEFLANVKHTKMHTQTHPGSKENKYHLLLFPNRILLTSHELCLRMFLVRGVLGRSEKPYELQQKMQQKLDVI